MMKSFKEYISEANLHLTHVADLSLEGKKRVSEGIQFLEIIVDMLRGNVSKKINLTKKWDGAPAVICGINPENDKFFVGTKSVFNKTPKINYTNADIKKNHTGGLVPKLESALKHLKKLKITGILQGDMLFSEGDLGKDTIDGKSFTTFTPNTITYAVDNESDLASVIKRAKMGIVFHTKYKGKDMKSLKSSFDVSKRDFKSHNSVWADDASFKDVSGKATLTKDEIKTIEGLIKKASNLVDGLKTVDSKVEGLINIYINSKVRTGDYSFSAKEFKTFVNDKMEENISKLKTEAGQERKRKVKLELLRQIQSQTSDINSIFKLNTALQKCVLFLVKKLGEIGSLRTFIKTKDGFRTTGDEGFVASDHVSGAFKLVDRLEFSRVNFTIDKNWSK